MRNLFRAEVFEAQTDSGFGEAIKIKPLQFSLYTLSAGITVIIVIFYLSIFSYTRKHTVQGYLLPSGGTVNVQSSRSGVISKILVDDGQFVQAGEPLLTITSSEWTEGGNQASQLLVTQLRKQKQWLGERLTGINKKFPIEQQELQYELDNISLSISFLEEQQKIQRERLSNYKKSLASKKGPLKKGLISKDEYAREYDRLLSAQETAQKIKSDLESQKNNFNQKQFQLDNIHIIQNERIIELKERISAKEQEIINATLGSGTVLNAPIDGRIIAINVRKGERATPGEPLVTIAEKKLHTGRQPLCTESLHWIC